MLTQSQTNLTNTKVTLDFFPKDLIEKYHKSNLEYDYCVEKFSEMQAAKRDSIPVPTMKIWYIEFIRLGWTKYKFDTQYEALIQSDILGYAIRIDHWINSSINKTNLQSYESYKPIGRKQTGGLRGLQEFIDGLDGKIKTKKLFYVDKETGEKIYYPELPPNWAAELKSNWRRGDILKSENRRRDKKK